MNWPLEKVAPRMNQAGPGRNSVGSTTTGGIESLGNDRGRTFGRVRHPRRAARPADVAGRRSSRTSAHLPGNLGEGVGVGSVEGMVRMGSILVGSLLVGGVGLLMEPLGDGVDGAVPFRLGLDDIILEKGISRSVGRRQDQLVGMTSDNRRLGRRWVELHLHLDQRCRGHGGSGWRGESPLHLLGQEAGISRDEEGMPAISAGTTTPGGQLEGIPE